MFLPDSHIPFARDYVAPSAFPLLVLLFWFYAPMHVYRRHWLEDFPRYTSLKKRILTVFVFLPLLMLFLRLEGLLGVVVSLVVNLLTMVLIIDIAEFEI